MAARTAKTRTIFTALTAGVSASALLLAGCTIDGGDLARQKESATATTESESSEPSKDAQETASSAPSTTMRESDTLSLSDIQIPGGAIALKTADTDAQVGRVDMPAWSTIKVPLAIAALRNQPGVETFVNSAIVNSSNPAAESLWMSMGDADTAGQLTEKVLSDGGQDVKVQTKVTRDGFSSFGQTEWSLTSQADFATKMLCVDGGKPVTDAMQLRDPAQNYGLATIEGALMKGGWGPDEQGNYQARQFGLIPARDGYIGVALAASPEDGTYEAAQRMLTEMAANVKAKTESLTGVSCNNVRS